MTNSYVAGILVVAGIQQVCESIQLFVNFCLFFQSSISFYSMSLISELNGTYLGKRWSIDDFCSEFVFYFLVVIISDEFFTQPATFE